MGLLNNVLTRQILLAALTFYALPVFWWSYNGMDDRGGDADDDDGYYLSVRFLMSTGCLMTSMGMTYVAMPLDLVPDFIPIFGQIDDMIAKLIAGGGMMMMYMGHRFGSGETPREFEVAVTAVSTIYGVAVPFLREQVVPLVAPAVAAASVPMKMAASAVWGMVLDQASDPDVQRHAADLASKAAAEL